MSTVDVHFCGGNPVNDQLNHWYQQVLDWYNNSSVNSCAAPHLKHRQQLLAFLEVLSRGLHTEESVNEILQKFPTVGQFLGRLVALPVLMSDREVCERVVSCMLRLYTNTPVTSVQHKAKCWVISQIRHLCGGTTDSTSALCTRVRDATGSSSAAHVHNTLEMVTSHLAARVDVRSSRPLPLIETCVALQQTREFSALCDTLTTRLCEREPQRVLNLPRLHHTELTASQASLPYPSQVSVWQHHRPSLERDVLDLVTHCSRLGLLQERDFGQITTAQYLSRACADDPSLYTAVFTMLKQLHHDSQSPLPVKLVSWLHHSVCLQIAQSSASQKPAVSVVSMFPSSVQPLVQMLLVNPKERTQSVCEHHLTQLHMVYTKTQPSVAQCEDLSVKFVRWKLTAVAICLVGSRKVLDAALNVVQMFYSCPESSMSSVRGLVLGVRGLRHKSSVTAADLQSVKQPVGLETSTSQLLGGCLLVFLFVSDAGHAVWREIMNWVSDCTSEVQPELPFLLHLTETLQVLHEFCPVWLTNLINTASISPVVRHLYSVLTNEQQAELTTDAPKQCPGETAMHSQKWLLENCKLRLEQFGINVGHQTTA